MRAHQYLVTVVETDLGNRRVEADYLRAGAQDDLAALALTPIGGSGDQTQTISTRDLTREVACIIAAHFEARS